MKNPEGCCLHPIKAADIVLIIAVVLFSVFLWLYRSPENVEFINISVKNRPIMRVSTEKSGTYPVKTQSGEVFMEVADGKYRLKKHNLCPNGYCWKTGWVSNRPIICVPLKLSIEPESRILDAMTE